MIGHMGNLGRSLVEADPEVRRSVLIGQTGQRRHGMSATNLAAAKYFRALRDLQAAEQADESIIITEESKGMGWLLPVVLIAGVGAGAFFLLRRKKASKR